VIRLAGIFPDEASRGSSLAIQRRVSARVSAFRFALKTCAVSRSHADPPFSPFKTSYLVYRDTLAICTSS